MSDECAHDAAWKEVPTVTNITPDGNAVARSAARAANAVAGTCPRSAAARLVQSGSGSVANGSAVPGAVVLARPRMQQLKKYPFTTHGAVINGAKLGPHRAWDPV